MNWTVDPRDAGQVVERSYRLDDDGMWQRRTMDRSDMSELVETADIDVDWDGGAEIPAAVREYQDWVEVVA